MKILIIDDEPFIVELVREFLTGQGHEVETASSGEEGIERFQKYWPRMVLLDMRMPGMSGLDVLRRLRKMDQDVGIIMISAFDEKQVREDALRLGVNAYLEKPIELQQLTTILNLWGNGKVEDNG